MAGAAAGREELEALARAAAWRLPAQLAALVVAGEQDPGRLASRLGVDVIAAAGQRGRSSPGSRTRRHRDAARSSRPRSRASARCWGPPGRRAGAASLRRARLGHVAIASGHLPSSGLLVADEHLLGLILHGAAAPEAAALSEALLAPLDALPAGARARNLATLRGMARPAGAGPAHRRETPGTASRRPSATG